MSTDRIRRKRSLGKLALLLVPILAGILVDGASEFLKVVAHGATTEWKDYLQWRLGNWSTLFDVPFALGFCVALLVLATLLLDKSVDPRPWVRNVLLVLSLVIVGALEPWTLFHRDELLHAYDGVYRGERLAAVLKALDDSRPIIQVHEDGMRNKFNSHVYCEQNCWLRLTYHVPSLWKTSFVEIDFDSDQRVIRNERIP
jgi:hypothetical protein